MRSVKLSSIALAAVLMVPFSGGVFPVPAQSVAAAHGDAPTAYTDAEDSFKSALTAAIIKKNVPASVVVDPSKAAYTLKSADVFANPKAREVR